MDGYQEARRTRSSSVAQQIVQALRKLEAKSDTDRGIAGARWRALGEGLVVRGIAVGDALAVGVPNTAETRPEPRDGGARKALAHAGREGNAEGRVGPKDGRIVLAPSALTYAKNSPGPAAARGDGNRWTRWK
jgi:hypothetical protein